MLHSTKGNNRTTGNIFEAIRIRWRKQIHNHLFQTIFVTGEHFHQCLSATFFVQHKNTIKKKHLSQPYIVPKANLPFAVPWKVTSKTKTCLLCCTLHYRALPGQFLQHRCPESVHNILALGTCGKLSFMSSRCNIN